MVVVSVRDQPIQSAADLSRAIAQAAPGSGLPMRVHQPGAAGTYLRVVRIPE
jgi:hypothetical protein